MRKKRFYQILTQEGGTSADINIYGDITSWEWFDSDVSAHSLKTEIDALDVEEINVCINSYGGEVAEALAICTSLTRHKAKIRTFCDGFACSAASIIFCAGEERIMGKGTLLMIHNCRSYLGYAESKDMRKAADDNDKINEASIAYYKQASNLPEDEIRKLMDKGSWLTAQECLEYGFATRIEEDEEEESSGAVCQSALKEVAHAVRKAQDACGEPGLKEVLEKLDQMQESIDGLSEQRKERQAGDKEGENFLETLFHNLI